MATPHCRHGNALLATRHDETPIPDTDIVFLEGDMLALSDDIHVMEGPGPCQDCRLCSINIKTGHRR